ncbi:p53 and DNA damage-regulated protein 1, partial [Gamsiella multidivaricata]
ASVQKREHSDTAHLDTGPGSVKEVNKDILFVIAEAVWELNREVRAELNRLQPKKKGEENSMENGSKTKTSTAEAAVCKGCHKSERQKTAPVDPAIAQLEQEILERVLGRHGLSKEDWGAWKTLQQKRHKEAHPKIGNVVDIAEMWKKWKSERWIVDYDRRRNSNREALTKLKKDLVQEKKVWVNLGDLFVKLPKENVETMIKKDQVTLDAEISDIRETMKEKVVELEKLEGGDGSKARAFQLKGMNK